MRVQVLGAVRLWRGGHEIAIGSVRQRAMLALLAAAGGQPLSRAEMILVLWSDQPPPSAINIIQTYVKHLRRILEPGRIARTPSAVIRAAGSGYALDTSEVDIDLVRFRELAAAAAQAYRRGDRASAAELFGGSLAQWSGNPFADIPLLAGHPKATSLFAERRAALLRYGEVMIALGAVGDVLPLLEDAVRGQPLDENMVALFIRACQAAGQRVRGFEAYHELRRRLADELGVDPSPDVVAAHAALLAHDGPAAAGDQPGGASESVVARPLAPGHVVPAQLPAANRAFAGRADELRRLDGFLASGTRPTAVTIVAIDGPAGVGKTTLALQWAHQHAGRYPDGQLYVNLRGFGPTGLAMSAAEAARRFLDALGVPSARIPAGVESQLDLYRSLLAGRQVLVLLDNARDAEQVCQLLPGAAGCLAVVTSRRRLSTLVATNGARPLTLDLLPSAEAKELVAHHVGGERVAAEPAPVDRIVAHCGRLPLALAVIAARAATRPAFSLADLAAELDRAKHNLDAFADDDLTTDIRSAFAWSYHALRPDAAGLFRLLGLHPGPDIAAASAALAGMPMSRVRPLLAELTSGHLVIEHAPGRYLMHDLLGRYAAELVRAQDSAAHRRAAVERLLDHYVHTAHAAAVLINPQLDTIPLPLEAPTAEPEPIRDPDQAWVWFEAERPNMLAAVSLAAAEGFDRHAWQLAWTLSSFLYRQGCWRELRAAQSAALESAQRLGNPVAQASAHRAMSASLIQLGRSDEAAGHLTSALGLFTAHRDTVGQAHTHSALDRLYGSQGRHAEALRHARMALDLHRSTGHLVGQADSLNAVAWDLAMLGHHEQALDIGRRAMDLLLLSGDRVGQAGAWDTIGYAQHHRGDHAAAVDSYRRAIELFRQVGELYAESVSWLHLGDAYRAVGDPSGALDAWRRALKILDQLDHPDAEQARNRLARDAVPTSPPPRAQ